MNKPKAPISNSAGPAAATSANPMTAATARSTVPYRAICAGVNTPFWMKRLPPVNGYSRSVLIASVPFSAS